MIELGEYPHGLISGYDEKILPRNWFTESKALYLVPHATPWNKCDLWAVERGFLSEFKTAHIKWPGEMDYYKLHQMYPDEIPTSMLCQFYYDIYNSFWTGNEGIWI